MRVIEAFKTLMQRAMMWKSTSSTSWKYLVFVGGLGLESYVCQLCVILNYALFWWCTWMLDVIIKS